jgi:hypothetical protein
MFPANSSRPFVRKKNIVRVPHLANLSNEFNTNQSLNENDIKLCNDQTKSFKILEPPSIMYDLSLKLFRSTKKLETSNKEKALHTIDRRLSDNRPHLMRRRLKSINSRHQ